MSNSSCDPRYAPNRRSGADLRSDRRRRAELLPGGEGKRLCMLSGAELSSNLCLLRLLCNYLDLGILCDGGTQRRCGAEWSPR